VNPATARGGARQWWPGGAPTLGRDRERAELARALERAARGRGAIVLLEGEAGIGKTRMLDEALCHAHSQQWSVLSMSCEELERERPFGALRRALDLEAAFRDVLGRDGLRERPHRPSETAELRFAVADAAAELIERRAVSGPLLLAVEDVHWADPSTILALRRIARLADQYPLALVVSVRPLPRSPELEDLLDELATTGACRVALAPLDPGAVAALAAELVAGDPGTSLLRQLEGAAGNPLFVMELAAALAEEGLLTRIGGKVEVSRPVLPPSLRLTILRRLGFLPRETLELLRMASVLGSPFALADLSALVGKRTAELLPALDPALAASLVVEAGTRLAFRHDLVREAIYGDLPGAVRTRLHAEIAAILIEGGASPSDAASHLSLGASPGDSRAVTWLLCAGRESMARAPSVAVELLEKASDLVDRDSRLQDQIHLELIQALVWAGCPEKGETVARRMIAEAVDASLDTAVLFGLSQALSGQGKYRQGAAEAERAARLLPTTDPRTAKLLKEAARCRFLSGDFEPAAEMAQEAQAAGAIAGDVAMVSWAVELQAGAVLTLGFCEEGLRLARQAYELGAPVRGEAARQVHPHHALAPAPLEFDELDEAEAVICEGMRRADAFGDLHGSSRYHAWLGRLHFLSGNWDRAVVDLEASLALADEVQRRGLVIAEQSMLAQIALHRGELAQAEPLFARMRRQMQETGPQYDLSLVLLTGSLLQEARAQPDRAFALLNEARAWVIASKARLHYRWFGPNFVRLAMGADAVQSARTVTNEVEHIAAALGTPAARGTALRCRGLVERDPDALREAVTALRASPRVVECALACEEAATAAADFGERAQARQLLEEAAGTFERIGAARDLSRVEAALRTMGVPRGRRGRRERGPKGWDSLTPTEQRVAALVAEGLSNPGIGERLFVSRRTVQTHVSHIFAKLGLSSRTELAAYVVRTRA